MLATDLTEDLKRPFADSALLSAKIVKDATLKVYPELPHGVYQTHKDQINADLFEFVKTVRPKS